MASRRSAKDGTDLYVQLYGRPSATDRAYPPPSSAASMLPPEGSSHWKEGDRDPTKRRDVPHLFPYFYHSVLARNGKPVHGRNITALIEYINALLLFQGIVWIEGDIKDVRTGEVFRQRFCVPIDDYEFPEERPDDVIDFLWAWRTTARPGLRQFLDQTYTDLTGPDSTLLKYGATLPFGIWQRG
ncbi:hypothetical protein [Streptomyces sp. NPDC087859]|uniref:hypothetical protein n=1 Tax=Streptomyces sp. NPDC087859 TaxID=3365812 RepID=UPI0038250341